ncbi:cytochrome P450 [Streptomyces sp. NPDC005551]|uniref:cytochrome P450 n=1 Tax=unclassified Streptomyces TaxID=2593676 RepID=UPI0033FCBCCD
MRTPPGPVADRTGSLPPEGHSWLPDRLRHATSPAVRTRLLGRHASGLRGPDAVRFFYDERPTRRRRAAPERVRSTLFGQDAAHTPDLAAHRVRRALLHSLLTPPDRVALLVEHVTDAWDGAVDAWRVRPEIVLFEEAAKVLTAGVCRWAGIPLDKDRVAVTAQDLVATVDGFATPGARHWQARRARAGCEARIADLVGKVRTGEIEAPAGSAVSVVVRHRDADGRPLDARTAAVELLNIVRPTVAVSWFVTFAAHALHRWPENRAPLRAGDAAYGAAFAQEVRRFYPFAPFTGGRAAADLYWKGEHARAGGPVLLGLYGQDRDAELWGDPYRFRPERFLARPAARDEPDPQGGADPSGGHRCPGEAVTMALLEALGVRLSRLTYGVPVQDLTIPLRHIPTRPRSGFRITGVRPVA